MVTLNASLPPWTPTPKWQSLSSQNDDDTPIIPSCCWNLCTHNQNPKYEKKLRLPPSAIAQTA